MFKEYPSVEYLNEIFEYNPESGVFKRKERPIHHFNSLWSMNAWNGRHSGKVVDSRSVQGYIESKVDCSVLKMHRVAWIMHYGEVPDFIDHINGLRDDNRIENLRNVSKSQNCKNRSKSSNNTSGVGGVSYHIRDDKWQASITVDAERIHLGYFENKHSASNARKNAEFKYYGEFRRK